MNAHTVRGHKGFAQAAKTLAQQWVLVGVGVIGLAVLCISALLWLNWSAGVPNTDHTVLTGPKTGSRVAPSAQETFNTVARGVDDTVLMVTASDLGDIAGQPSRAQPSPSQPHQLGDILGTRAMPLRCTWAGSVASQAANVVACRRWAWVMGTGTAAQATTLGGAAVRAHRFTVVDEQRWGLVADGPQGNAYGTAVWWLVTLCALAIALIVNRPAEVMQAGHTPAAGHKHSG
jgi:hypothetical protein